MANKKNSREYALSVVEQTLEEGVHCDTAMHHIFRQYTLEQVEKSFIKRLSYGVIERKIELDYMINQVSKTKVKKMKPLIRNVLRMGVYELKYMDQIPASATCNEMVKIVKRRKLMGLTGFVNGVLRNVERKKSEIVLPDLSTRYSMPQWIVDHLTNEVGEEQVEKVLEALLSTRPVTLRVNTEKVSVEEYKKLLSNQGIQVEDGAYLPYALRIQGEFSPEQLPGFREGFFVAQDESSMLPVALAGIEEGSRVLDVCAAPGGKTMQAVQALHQTGMVIARDVSEYKVGKIRENVERLGLENVKCEIMDARVRNEDDIRKMDVVIADVPCSGIGIIGKKPDIKYQISQESLSNLVNLQQEILDVVMDYVKPGGILMYSTCTINQKENRENVQYILDSKKFKLESLRKDIPEMVQIIPGIQESDGFFVARLRRMEEQ